MWGSWANPELSDLPGSPGARKCSRGWGCLKRTGRARGLSLRICSTRSKVPLRQGLHSPWATLRGIQMPCSWGGQTDQHRLEMEASRPPVQTRAEMCVLLLFTDMALPSCRPALCPPLLLTWWSTKGIKILTVSLSSQKCGSSIPQYWQSVEEAYTYFRELNKPLLILPKGWSTEGNGIVTWTHSEDKRIKLPLASWGEAQRLKLSEDAIRLVPK